MRRINLVLITILFLEALLLQKASALDAFMLDPSQEFYSQSYTLGKEMLDLPRELRIKKMELELTRNRFAIEFLSAQEEQSELREFDRAFDHLASETSYKGQEFEFVLKDGEIFHGDCSEWFHKQLVLRIRSNPDRPGVITQLRLFARVGYTPDNCMDPVLYSEEEYTARLR